MTIFKDKKGRSWNVELNLKTARDLEKADFSAIWEDKHINILNREKINEGFFTSFLVDAACTAFVVWVLIFEQAQQQGITEDDFAEGLGGEELNKLREIVWDEFADFFYEHRTSLLTLKAKFQKIQDQINAKTEKAIDQINVTVTDEDIAGLMST